MFSSRPSKLFICIKLCILLKHSYQVSCVCLRFVGKCDRKLKLQLVLDFDLRKGERKINVSKAESKRSGTKNKRVFETFLFTSSTLQKFF